MGKVELNVQWEKYSKDSKDFIFNQAEKLLADISNSLRETTNKSYAALAIYAGIMSFCINKLLDGNHSFVYILVLAGAIVSIGMLYLNFFPPITSFRGSAPKVLFHEYYEDCSPEEQLKKQKEESIKGLQRSIDNNLLQLNRKAKAFSLSIIIFTFVMIAAFIISLFRIPQ